jgi:MATE family multidrug resistance protein
MISSLFCYWSVGLPLGWFLTFRQGRGVDGLWIGLAAGLLAAGLVLLWAWSRKAAALTRGEVRMAAAGAGR